MSATLPSAPVDMAAVVESSHDAMIGKTLDSVITSWNPAATWLYGHRAEDIVGQHAGILFPPYLQAEEVGLLRRIIAGGQVAHYQTERICADGTVILVLLSMSPIFDSTGTLVGVMSCSRGLDEQARTGTCVADLSPIVSERTRLEARNVQDRREAQVDKAATAATNELYRHESEEHRRGLEAQLRQAQRLESLGLLAGGVAHDFNNLLTTILSFGTFAAEHITAGNEQFKSSTGSMSACLEDAASEIKTVRHAADRGARLTRQLLAFGRREVVQAEVMDLNKVIVEVAGVLRQAIGESVELTLSLTEPLHPVLADPCQLERVLFNLAQNARDAMPAGGTLNIETTNIVVNRDDPIACSAGLSGANVRLRISDTGVGMPAAVAARVFEPFFTTKALGSGTGLGLASVYGTIAQAEGHIYVTSKTGVGTTFTIVLPATEATFPTVAPVAPLPAAEGFSHGGTVLVVEDEETLREVTRRMLTRNGYQVLMAANGLEAMGIALRHDAEIDLLITDVVMPGMLGKEVAQKLRMVLPRVQVLYMSGYARPVLASQGRLDPGTALLEKPFTEVELLKKAAHVLRGGFSDSVPPAPRYPANVR